MRAPVPPPPPLLLVLLLLLLAALPAIAGGAGGAADGPAFVSGQRTAVAARAGDAAELVCRVQRLADRAVSWVRSGDLQILTHAGTVFTADARVSCAGRTAPAGPAADYEEGYDEHGAPDAPDAPDVSDVSVHVLRIARLRAADAGRYECQVNTEPKMSLLFDLTVLEGAAAGGGGGDVVVWAEGGGAVWGAAGGAARLACGARYAALDALAAGARAALPPLRIRWTRDGRALDRLDWLGGVSVQAERWAGGAVSRLTLAPLRAAHAGRYECRARAAAAAVTLRVRAAAPGAEAAGGMQRDQAAVAAPASAARAPLPAPAPAALLLPLLLPLLLLLLPA